MGARFVEKILTFLFDTLATIVAFATTFWLRYEWLQYKSYYLPEGFDPTVNFASYSPLLFILTGAWLALFFFI